MPSDNSGTSLPETLPGLSIVLPTYNERENIGIFVPRLEEKFKGTPHEIIVVDDSFPDGTGDEVRAVPQTQEKRSERNAGETEKLILFVHSRSVRRCYAGSGILR